MKTEDLPPETCRNESVLTAITVEVTDSGGPYEMIIVKEPIAVLAGDDCTLYPSRITGENAACYQEDVV
jgi:hypothetical protein